MADHHLPDELLLEYATGSADPGHALIAACHVTLCPRCRGTVAEFEALGAAMVGLGLDGGEEPADFGLGTEASGLGSDLDSGLADRILAGLAGQLDEVPEEPALPLAADAPGSLFPWPLREVIGSFEDLAWRRPLPGLQTFDFQLPGAKTVTRMTRAGPGMKVARHGHRGLELDLILSGGLHDRTRGGDFERGAIQSADAEVDHRLEILPGEPCLILTVNEGDFVPKGLLSKLLYAYLGWG